MKSVIALSDDQLALVKDGKQVVLCTPLVKQPPDRFEYSESTVDSLPQTKTAFFFYDQYKHRKLPEVEDNCIAIPLQYPKDRVFNVREAWAYAEPDPLIGEHGAGISELGDMKYWYKSTHADDLNKPLQEALIKSIKWLSPQSMPKDAIRTHVKVVDVSVKRVQGISHSDWERIGAWYDNERSFLINANWIKQWFNAKYAKPRARRKNGKIIGYECWCYELNQAVLEKHKYIEFGFKHEELLKIHPDPFVELTTLEVK